MNQNFAAIMLGGTGQVGGAAVAELLAIPECREVVMVTRKPIAARSRVRNVVLDTRAADFADRTAALAREVLSQGPVSGEILIHKRGPLPTEGSDSPVHPKREAYLV